MDHTAVPVRKYLLIFTAAYAVMLVVIAAILQLTDINSNHISYAAFFGAIGFAAAQFAKDQNRVPDTQERLKFAFGSLLLSTFVSVLLMALILLYVSTQPGGAGEIAELAELFRSYWLLMLVVLIVISGIDFAAAYFMFRWFAGSTIKAIERRKAKTAPRLF